jgi:hypothetical protein
MTIDAHAFRQESSLHPTDPVGAAVDTLLLELLVMRAFGLDLPTLVSDRRGQAPVAFARQVAIYLSHVHLRMSISAAARRFRRDRSTAALDHLRAATAAGGATPVHP